LHAVQTRRPIESALLPTFGVVAAFNSNDGTLEVVTSAMSGSHVNYVQDTDGSWVYATHLPTLIQQLGRWPALDEAELVSYALLTPRTRPPLVGVDTLGTGCRLCQRAGNAPAKSTWFKLDLTVLPGTVDEWVEHYCAEIDEVLRIDLPETGDVSALMSGGLDSTMVVGSAAGVMGRDRRINAMCLDPMPAPDGTGDKGRWLYTDLPDAMSMQRMWPSVSVSGLRNDVPLTPLDVLPDLFDLTGMPVLNPSNSVWMRLGFLAAQARGDEAVLTGQSGNLAFSFSPPDVVAKLAARGRVGAVMDALRTRSSSTGNSMWYEARVALVSPARTAVGRRLRVARTPDESWKRMAAIEQFPALRRETIEWLGLSERLDRVSPFGTRFARNAVKAGALPRESCFWSPYAHGVRFLDPLAAAPLVSLVAGLPDTAYVGVGPDRSFARRTMVDRVPDTIRLRLQRGQQAADARQWFTRRPDTAAALMALARDPVVASLVDVDQWLERAPGPERPWTLGFDRTLGVAMYLAWYGEKS
jgi:hypothetical protein